MQPEPTPGRRTRPEATQMHVYNAKSNATRAAKRLTEQTGQAHEVVPLNGGYHARPVPIKPAPKAGKVRSIVISQASRKQGASASELYVATGWTKTSWNHQLNQAAASSGLRAEVRKVDGVTRYFLTGGEG